MAQLQRGASATNFDPGMNVFDPSERTTRDYPKRASSCFTRTEDMRDDCEALGQILQNEMESQNHKDREVASLRQDGSTTSVAGAQIKRLATQQDGLEQREAILERPDKKTYGNFKSRVEVKKATAKRKRKPDDTIDEATLAVSRPGAFQDGNEAILGRNSPKTSRPRTTTLSKSNIQHRWQKGVSNGMALLNSMASHLDGSSKIDHKSPYTLSPPGVEPVVSYQRHSNAPLESYHVKNSPQRTTSQRSYRHLDDTARPVYDPSRPTVADSKNFACCDPSVMDGASGVCAVPCGEDCTDQQCNSCEGSQVSCEPCSSPELCYRGCDDPFCLEDVEPGVHLENSCSQYPQSLSPISPEPRYVNPRDLELPCHWQMHGQQCDASMHSLQELNQHVQQHHIQPQAQIACQWQQCGNDVDIDSLQDHLLQHHNPMTGSDAYICLWQGCKYSFASPEELDSESNSKFLSAFLDHNEPFYIA